MKTQQKKTAVAALIGIALVAFVWYSFNGTPTASGSKGTAAVSFVVRYKDGTQDVFNAPNSLSVMPLTLYIGGKEISSVDARCYATLDKSVTAWTASINQRVEVYKGGASSPATSSTGGYTKTGSAWAQGETKELLSTTLSGSQIENAIKQYGDGAWLMNVAVTITITATDAAGVSSTINGQGAGGLNFVFQSTQAMSVVATLAAMPLT